MADSATKFPGLLLTAASASPTAERGILPRGGDPEHADLGAVGVDGCRNLLPPHRGLEPKSDRAAKGIEEPDQKSTADAVATVRERTAKLVDRVLWPPSPARAALGSGIGGLVFRRQGRPPKAICLTYGGSLAPGRGRCRATLLRPASAGSGPRAQPNTAGAACAKQTALG